MVTLTEMEDTQGMSVCQEGINNLRRHATEPLVKILMVHKNPVFTYRREAPTSGTTNRRATGQVSQKTFCFVF